MAAWSKLLNCNCYELGHTWTPSCTQATLDIACSAFLESFKIYAALYLAAALFRGRVNGKGVIVKKVVYDILKSTLFLGTTAWAFMAGFCIWRRTMGFYFFFNVFVCATPVSALAVLFEDRSRRSVLALYMANVAVETMYRMAKARGLVSPIKNGEVLLFCIATAVTMFLYRRPNGLSPSITSALNFLLGRSELPPLVEPPSTAATGSLTSNMNRTRSRPVRSYSVVSLLPNWAQSIMKHMRQGPKHVLCRHSTSCLSSTVEASARAFAIGYAAQTSLRLAAVLPSVLTHPRKLLRAFVGRDSVRLGAFLASFVCTFKGASCLMRWLTGQDSDMQTVVAGFLAGASMIFYKSSTIALYAACKVAEVLYMKGVDAGKLPNFRHADIAVFSVATALVFHAAVFEAHNLRPSYWQFLLRLTHGRFAEMNRNLLEVYGTQATQLFGNWWPNYDPKYSRLARNS